jgi:hypothetical protein
MEGNKRFRVPNGVSAANCVFGRETTAAQRDRLRQLRYAKGSMKRRVVVLFVLISVLFQGATLSYAATLGSAGVNSTSQSMPAHCGTFGAAGLKQCDGCCSHGFMLSCAAFCLSSADTAGPLSDPVVARIPLRGVLLRDGGVTGFVDHHPPHLLRPPIL